MIDQEFVKYIVSALVSDPEAVKVERSVDDRGVLLTLQVAEDDLGRVIGRKGSTAQSLRVLLRALGSKNEAHYNLRILDKREGDRVSDDKQHKEDSASEGNTNLDSDFAQDTPVEVESQSPPADSLAEETKKELDNLNDLDI